MTICPLLFCFASLVTFAFAGAMHQSQEGHPADLSTNKVNFSDSFVVEWKVDEKAQSIHFKLNVVVDEKGWVLLGFMPAPNNSDSAIPRHSKIQETKGDFVLTWFSSASRITTLDLNTIKADGELQVDDNSTRVDYHVTKSPENSTVLHITRKLDTGDAQDVPITDRPLCLFGAYGNSDVYLTDLSNITSDDIDDTLMMKKVIMMAKNDSKTEDSNKPWHKVLKEQVRKHWMGVVIGMAGLVTVMIVATVYLCSRKGRDKAKKIKMTFYKEDEDDEARVAFLHSRT